MEIETIRHSLAHVMACAVKEIYGEGVKFGIGPAIENGFYYDFDVAEPFKEEDFEKIENKMKEIIKGDFAFIRKEVSKKEALQIFKDQPYKVELINDLPEGETISTYAVSNFLDLCRGPHVEHVKFLRNVAFKLDRTNTAYWRGDEKNKMLYRIYALAFETKDELKNHIKMVEEALKRDHRKIGKEQGLYFFSEYAPGMPFYMPNGEILKDELIDFWKEMHRKADYVTIETPIALNRKLWEISGHWTNYKENMYTFKIEDEDFAIKPMSCPGAILYYKEDLHSYKEFPLRVGELGRVHRHESSGTLHGLMRVRSFVQDDAHIFMLPSQIEEEIKGVLELVDKMYAVFGLSAMLELSTMPENHIGDEKEWEIAENGLKSALEHLNKPYVLNEGDGAFYGPKIDIHIKDAIGRTWQCGTIQLDMQLPKRFELYYTDADGTRKEPVMIHRVIYGSIDRFIGIITEHFAGNFPLWISPKQVGIVPVSENNFEYCKKIKEQFLNANIRVDLNLSDNGMGAKVNKYRKEKTPYVIIIGDKEQEEGTFAIKTRTGKQINDIDANRFISIVSRQIHNKELELVEDF